MKALEEKFEAAKTIGQEQIQNLFIELKSKCQELNQLKSSSEMKDSGLIVFENKGNSTLPSYQNLEGSIMENEMKYNRIAHSFIKEE